MFYILCYVIEFLKIEVLFVINSGVIVSFFVGIKINVMLLYLYFVKN